MDMISILSKQEILLRWIIGKIKEQTHILHGTIFFKVLLEETCSFHVDLIRK